jgi:hypothetical protein
MKLGVGDLSQVKIEVISFGRGAPCCMTNVPSKYPIIVQFPSQTPVIILNLLKFNSQANYLAGQDVEPCNGFEAFMRYGIASEEL